MNDLIVVFSLIVISSLFLILMIFIIALKSLFLNNLIEKKYPNIAKNVIGRVRGPFGFSMSDGVRYFIWVLKNVKRENKEVQLRKKSMRKALLIFVILLSVIILCSIYLLYIR